MTYISSASKPNMGTEPSKSLQLTSTNEQMHSCMTWQHTDNIHRFTEYTIYTEYTDNNNLFNVLAFVL